MTFLENMPVPDIATDLESQLASRRAESVRQALVDQLRRAEQRLTGALLTGLAPERFHVTLACAQAIGAALETLALQACTADRETDTNTLFHHLSH